MREKYWHQNDVIEAVINTLLSVDVKWEEV